MEGIVCVSRLTVEVGLHRISDNDSKTESARLIATFLIKTEVLEREGPGILVQVEPEYADKVNMEEAFKEG